MTRQQIKALAKEKIKGKIGILFLIMLVNGLIISVASMIPVVGSIVGTFVIGPAFSIAIINVYLNLAESSEYRPEIGDLFKDFDKFWLAFKVTFFTGLFTMLWMCLFYVPGIIKAFSYSQSMYIAAENPNIGALEAITRSRKMMDGHKMELFLLGLSFIGWAILGAFTLGILYIWLVPYMYTSMAIFHNSIKPDQGYTLNQNEYGTAAEAGFTPPPAFDNSLNSGMATAEMSNAQFNDPQPQAPATVKCPACGVEIEAGRAFCSNCGAMLNK